MIKHKSRITTLTIVALAIATGSVALAQGDTPVPSHDPATVAQVEPAASSFAVLRGPHVTLPENVIRVIGTSDQWGLRTSEAVAVQAPAGERSGEPWYVIPGETGMCLFTEEDGVCGSLTHIREVGSLWFLTPGSTGEPVDENAPLDQRGWTVRGVAIDEVSNVVASGVGRGETGNTAVRGNAFRLNLPRGGDRLSLKDDTGKVVRVEQVGRRATD